MSLDLVIRLVADGLVAVIVAAGAFAYFVYVKRDRWQAYLRAFMAGLSALTAAKLLSLLYQTAERPFVTLGVAPKAAYLDNPGFPSDHALFVMVIALVIGFATKNWRFALILIILGVAVGVGRVVALVHTPADVIGGFAAALLGVTPWYMARPGLRRIK